MRASTSVPGVNAGACDLEAVQSLMDECMESQVSSILHVSLWLIQTARCYRPSMHVHVYTYMVSALQAMCTYVCVWTFMYEA